MNGVHRQLLVAAAIFSVMSGYAHAGPFTQNWTVYPGEVIGPATGSPTTGACVLKEGSTFKAWYDSDDPSTDDNVMYKTSADGRAWGAAQQVYTSPGNQATPEVAINGGTYYMWVDGDFATSANGTTWQKQGEVTLFDRHYTVLPTAGGFEASYEPQGEEGYHYATSADGRTWHDHGLVLPNGAPRSTFDFMLSSLDVIKVGSTYHMWYAAYHGLLGGGAHSAYATSTDGISWTKHGLVSGFD